MKEFLTISSYIFLLLSCTSCYKEVVVFNPDPNNTLELEKILRLNNKDCSFDESSNTLRYSIPSSNIKDFEVLVEFQDYSKVYFNDSLLSNNSINNFGNIEVNRDYPVLIITNEIAHELKLQFTNLPIVQIITHNRIVDEPKVLARLVINYPSIDQDKTVSYIGLEYRGETSQSHPKKSFSFCFLNSLFTNDKISKSIFQLPENSDWWLDAMYIDKSRLRNKTSFDIWRQIEGSRNYGINSSFVELYINSEHQGLYSINELINAESLNLLSDDAVLYKAVDWSGPRFDFYSEDVSINKYWDGWEQKFPDVKNRINWQPLLYLRNIIINGSSNDFTSDIDKMIHLDNFIDYYIFLNLSSSLDNVAKNNFLSRQSNKDPLCIIPWDMDGSFGLMWNGDYISHTYILSNNLFDRLLDMESDQFKNNLKLRWTSLREESLNNDNLMNLFEGNFNCINTSNIIQIENNTWNTNINLEEEKIFIHNWLSNRLSFLDDYYLNL